MKTYSRGTKKEVRKAMKNLENALKSDEQQQTIAEKSEIDKQLELEKIRKDNLMLQIELAKLQQGINPLKVVR
jgi:type II secretory pathway component PulM